MKRVSAFLPIVLLGAEYIVCRYVLFSIHQMKSIPLALLFFCVIVVLLSTIFDKKICTIFTVVGYILSFFMGVIFEDKWIDSHGTSMSNLWIWFVCGTVVCVIVGIGFDILTKIKKTGNFTSKK